MKKAAAVLVLVFVFLGATAQAVIVVNPGFNLPGDGKHNMWDIGTNGKGTFTTDVPGWTSDTPAGDSGVETDSGAPDGDGWRAFLDARDPDVWQITSEAITEGMTYTLTVALTNTGGGGDQGTIHLIADDSSTVLASLDQALTTSWIYTSLSYTATASDAGKLLGVRISGDTTDGSGWIGIDDVTLVPEPATLVLLGLGGILLRRKSH